MTESLPVVNFRNEVVQALAHLTIISIGQMNHPDREQLIELLGTFSAGLVAFLKLPDEEVVEEVNQCAARLWKAFPREELRASGEVVH